MRKAILEAFQAFARLEPHNVEAYAKTLIFNNYAPAFGEFASHRPLQESPWHGEMKKQLERGWWEHTGNALVEALLREFQRHAQKKPAP